MPQAVHRDKRGPQPKIRHPSRPLPAREETFCQNIVAGMTKKAAWFAAGFGANEAKPTNINRLAKLPEVIWRIQWLRMKQAQRLNVTMDSLVLELVEAYETARVLGNPSAMVAATMAKAKLVGIIGDDKDTEGRIPLPSPIPTTVVELTQEEWERQFKPRQIN